MFSASNFILALALSMDSFAVSICCSSGDKTALKKKGFLLAACFGFTQGIFVLSGYFFGYLTIDIFKAVDHWIALFVLAAIGGKMIWDSFHPASVQQCPGGKLDLVKIVSLSIATSIDAAAAGFGVSFAGFSFAALAITTGVVTFVISLLGFFFGTKLFNRCGSGIERIGGALLILLGIKIFAEHIIYAV